ncbi:MAG: hypothetical protein LUQ24_02455 [Methanobacterium sp.]|jgi:hypothetical protein|nr:hypothetical protein [Methanobacterium sp.]
MESFGEKIKLIKEDDEVLLKLYNKKAAIFFGIWLTSCRVDYNYIPILNDDDMLYNPDDHDEEYEYLFRIQKNDWKNIMDDINWEKD